MPLTPWVTRLLVANGAMFLVTMVFPGLGWRLALVPVYLPIRPWTAVTYMFLHADFWHLLFNMLALFFFGPRLELRLGSRRFLGLYFTSGLVAAALSVLVRPSASIVGASGAIFGVLLGFARYWPREMIYIWGVLPIQARWFVAVMAALSLYFGVTAPGSGIAHFAHLGGFVGGLLYLKWAEARSPGNRFRRVAGPPPSPDAATAARWQSIRRDDIHPVNRDELDRLLEKIRTAGVGSLTPDERAFLERFSRG